MKMHERLNDNRRVIPPALQFRDSALRRTCTLVRKYCVSLACSLQACRTAPKLSLFLWLFLTQIVCFHISNHIGRYAYILYAPFYHKNTTASWICRHPCSRILLKISKNVNQYDIVKSCKGMNAKISGTILNLHAAAEEKRRDAAHAIFP